MSEPEHISTILTRVIDDMKEKKCFNCESRYPGCHAECEYYLAWKREHDKVKAEENAERKKEYDRKSYDVERHDRVIKATK